MGFLKNKGDKNMANDTMKWIGIVLVVVAVLHVTGIYQLPFLSSSDAGIVNSDGTVTKVTSACTSATSVTYNAYDKYTTSTVREGTDYIKVDGGVPKTAYATGAFGQKLNVLHYNVSQFAAPVEVTLGCDAQSIDIPVMTNATGGQTYNVFDDQFNVITNSAAGTTNLTIGSGATKLISIDLTAPSKEAVAPYGGIWCIEGSETTFDSSNTVANFGTPASKPKRISVAAAGNFVNCYKDTTDLSNGATFTGKMAVDAADSQDPTGTTVRVHLVPMKYFLDADGTYKLGTEDSTNADISPADYLYIVGVN